MRWHAYVLRVQGVIATPVSFSDGVIQSRVCHGRPLKECAESSRFSRVSWLMLVLLGKLLTEEPVGAPVGTSLPGDLGSQK